MTTDQLKALRELASRATPGEWRTASMTMQCRKSSHAPGAHTGHRGVDPCVYERGEPSAGNVTVIAPGGGAVIDADDNCVVLTDDNAAFIAAACPATVIALLDEMNWLRSEKWKAEGEAENLRSQLAAMTRARDEACTLIVAATGTNGPMSDEAKAMFRESADALRLIGSKESHE